MKVKKNINIELRYWYIVEVEVEVDEDDPNGDWADYDEEMKEEAFAKACVEHSTVSKREVETQRNLSDTWQAYDENGECI